MMRRMPLSKAFTLMEPGPVVLVTTTDGHILNRKKEMRSKLPEGVKK